MNIAQQVKWNLIVEYFNIFYLKYFDYDDILFLTHSGPIIIEVSAQDLPEG